LPLGVNVVTKLIDEPVKVNRRDSSIISFVWRERLYRVEKIVNWWREPSEWWNGEEIHLFVRVVASNPSTGAYELCKLGGVWLLHRILD